MALNSDECLFAFLPLVLLGFYFVIRYAKPPLPLYWLLCGSIGFYAYSSVSNLAVILGTIVFNYWVAAAISALPHDRGVNRTAALGVGIAANLLILGYFKYTNFLIQALNTSAGTHIELLNTAAPLGLSFITFQNLSFLIDVYAGEAPVFSLLNVAFYTLFFPRVVAGPILRYQEIGSQVNERFPRNSYADCAIAICLVSIGLFKKSILADNLGKFVTPTFDFSSTRHSIDFVTAWTGTLAYTLQLYFDFSGYSDMALGLARLFGIRFPMNFNSPYKATSIVDFWSRWHITLTRFLTIYVYTPLALHLTHLRLARGQKILKGARSSPSAIVVLLAAPTLITMMISGLWHGAGYQFLVWGALHGAYLTINQTWRLFRPKLFPNRARYERAVKLPGLALTFCAVAIAFVFFRSPTLTRSWSILESMAGVHGFVPPDYALMQGALTHLPWRVVWTLVTPYCWIGALLSVVMLAPNSLEMLSRYQPALDFPNTPHTTTTVMNHSASPAVLPTESDRVRQGLAQLLAKHRSKRYWIIPRDALAAALAAALFVLGIMSLNESSEFLYWKF